MKTRRTLASILALLMASSAFAGCSGGGTAPPASSAASSSSAPPAASSSAPASSAASGASSGAADTAQIDLSEKLTFTAMAGFRPQHADFKDMDIVQKTCADANIEITWELVPDASLKEKKSLALSTGDIPDVMLGMIDSNDLQKNSAQFLALDEFSAYTPNMNKILADREDVRKYIMLPDGHYYSLAFWHEKPYEGAYNDLYINQAWLDKVGLAQPNTIDEFEQMLIAFKTKDPNGNGQADEIPFTFMLDHNYFGLYGMYGAFGSIDNQGKRLHIKDGQVYFTADKDEWKAATAWFAKLNSQGLLDIEGFTQDRSMLFAKGKSNPEMIGSLHAFLVDNVVGGDRVDHYSYCLPLQNADGARVARFDVNPIASRSTSVVSKKAKNPERLIYWLDSQLTAENSLQNTYGTIGKQLAPSTTSGFKYDFAVAPEGMSQDDYRFKQAPANFPAFIPKELYGTLQPAPDVARKIGYMNDTEQYLTKEYLPPVLFTDAETKELATISSTITDYVLQQQALWISNKSDIEKDWAAYQAQLKNLSVDRYVQIYQDAVDRYYKG